MIDFKHLKENDLEVYNLVMEEYNRQNDCLEMIASENEPSEAVLEAQASYHTLKYAEGYPGKRYYGGCRIIDKTEQLAIDRACELFKCKYANVQPHSGANANTAVQFALVPPGGRILGMSLNSGGHLTHGAKPTFSGKYFDVMQYDVNEETYKIDYKDLENKLYDFRPHLLIVGTSAYPRFIDFKKIREIVDKWNDERGNFLYADEIPYCYFMVDMAHIAGLVAAELHPDPVKYADVVTSTTHKTLRGPRGGLILTNNEDIIKKVNSAVFPGTQGGPLENIIAAKAVCFGEALKPEFKEYQKDVIMNCQTLAVLLKDNGIKLLTGGTDNHLILLDLRGTGLSGKDLESRLEEVGIITNKNAIPFDTEKKTITSGLRLGTAAITSRGLQMRDMMPIAEVIIDCIKDTFDEFKQQKNELYNKIHQLCEKYPLYKD